MSIWRCRHARLGWLIATAMLGAFTAAIAEGPFLDLSFEDAKARAVKENKPIFIDFYTTWCGPCRMLERTTWKDAKVIEWLGRHAIALKIDAEKEERLAGQYRVNAYPTLLFLKPDGTELERITGFVEAKEFIAEGEGILSGKDALARAREKMEAAGANDPMARMQYGRTLADRGKSAEALKEYLWCFDEGAAHSVGFIGVRLSFLLYDIKKLGQSYPPAMDALGQRRDKARDRVLAGKGGMQAAMELSALNETLDDGPGTVEIFEQLKKEHPNWPSVGYLREMLFDRLLKEHRYNELYDEKNLESKADTALDNLQPNMLTRLAMLKIPKEQREEAYREQGRMFLQQLGACYEIMVGSGHAEEAAKLADRVLKADNSADAYNTLAWGGYMTNRPVPANLDQARKAYELSQGKSAAIADTYARLLVSFNRRNEGLAILRKAVAENPDGQSQEILTRCMEQLEEPASESKNRVVAITTGAGAAVLIAALLILFRRSRKKQAPPAIES